MVRTPLTRRLASLAVDLPSGERLRRCVLLPRSVIDRVLISCTGGNETPTDRPLVIVVEPLARVWGRRGVQQSRELEVLEVDQAARFFKQIVGVFFGVLVDRGGGARLGSEHFCKRRAIQLVAGRFAAGRVG